MMDYLYIINGKYVFRLKRNGKEYRKTIGDVEKLSRRKDFLQKVVSELYLKAISGEWDKEKELKEKQKENLTTFGKLAYKFLEWYKVNRRASSYYRYEKIVKGLINFFGYNLPIDKLNLGKIEDYKVYRKKQGVKDDTINKELRFISSMINRAVDFEWIESHKLYKKTIIIRGVDNSRIRYLTEDEEKRLLEASKHNRLLHDIIITALYTGFRKNEILNLKWDNVDLKQDKITLYPEQTKNKKFHIIPIHPVLKEVLLYWYSNRKGDYVFHRDGKQVVSIREAFARACKRAGIEDLRFHDLRHTFATKLVNMGVDIYIIKELLNHSDIRMTLRYAHLTYYHKLQALLKL